MIKKNISALALCVLGMVGCATQNVSAPQSAAASDCCGNQPEVVYVDRAITECTRPVRLVTQTNPCSSCERFPVTVRASGGCTK